MLNSAIPYTDLPGEYSEILPNGEQFVELSHCRSFCVRMQYPRLGMKNAECGCFVRETVADMLFQAQKMLPDGLKLCILDAWRPFKLQKELYVKYKKNIICEFNLNDAAEAEKSKIVRKFVSAPNNDKYIPPVHTTGGAVDVTLIMGSGEPLDMGCPFDVFSEYAYTNSFETQNNVQIKANRRILYNVMIKAGFTNLPSEWWHYDFGDSFWAYYKNTPALYEGIFTKEEIVIKNG